MSFNPTLVRLRPETASPTPSPWRGFNPTLVRLRHCLPVVGRSGKISFNPTLVRLRRLCDLLGNGVDRLFQSHAGSIEAWRFLPSGLDSSSQFQSHAGSIEAQGPKAGRDDYDLRFNPTLVRLRQAAVEIPRVPAASFNPTLVRLRPQPECSP